jgi:hypothetical protein
VADPAKKPIRITFFWADEAAVVQDFRAKHSEKLVEWASAFYGRYGFELDVWPRPGGTVAEANRFCLSKSDGYELDLIGPDALFEEYAKDRDVIVASAKKINTEEWTPLREEEKTKRLEINVTIAQMSSAANLTDIPPLIPTLRAQVEDLDRILDKLEKIRARYEELQAFLDNRFKNYLKRKEAVDFNLPVRALLAGKVLQSVALGVAGIRNADHANIIDPSRLKVIHCRFRLSPGVMTLKRDPQPFGGTTPYSGTKQGLNFNAAGGKPIWDGDFMMINTNRHENITLAHELVHAAGRGHIAEFKRIKPASKWITGLDPDTQQVASSLYENVPDPGYYDGPPNDIINYNAKGRKPEDVILQDSDKANLEKAFFVVPPNP